MPRWGDCELPSVPQLIKTEELNSAGQKRLDFLRECLWTAFPDQRIRSIRGINRLLQNSFPHTKMDFGFKLDIGFTEQLCDIWMRSGCSGLIAASRESWDCDNYGRVLLRGTSELNFFGFKEAHPDEADIFYFTDSVHQQIPCDLRYWRLAAIDQFGKYTAFVATPAFEEPDSWSARSICLWQFRRKPSDLGTPI